LREILGTKLADSEDSLFWGDLFEDLKETVIKGYRRQSGNLLLDQAGKCVTYI
jgi:hypothetical protein